MTTRDVYVAHHACPVPSHGAVLYQGRWFRTCAVPHAVNVRVPPGGAVLCRAVRVPCRGNTSGARASLRHACAVLPIVAVGGLPS